LEGTGAGGLFFGQTGWSRDGKRLAGTFSHGGRPAAIGVYDLGRRMADVLVEEAAYSVRWLSDSRRIVYFTGDGAQLVVFDTATRKRTPIEIRLPGPAMTEMFGVSPDDRTIYYGAVRAEADIWIVERK
jgi:Tol biopolymer transport system component